MIEPASRRIAIVGGGFVGTAIACHVLTNAPAKTMVTLVNSGGQLTRGLAYGTRSANHVLNVPAARMGWCQAEADGFAIWLKQRGLPYEDHAFVPRSLYGDYLSDTLQSHIKRRPDVIWEHRLGAVVDLRQEAAGHSLMITDSGSPLAADSVVLALGNFAPHCPHADLGRLPANLYTPDPWHPQAMQGLSKDAKVLIVGTGLTMLDVLASLHEKGHKGEVLALSRRGLLPLSHRRNEMPPPQWTAPAGWPLSNGGGLKQILHEIRTATKQASAQGMDWRDVWVGLRPLTAMLWQSLSPGDRAQFLRHLQAVWDVHRHRAAPVARDHLEQWMKSGRLSVAAGRVQGVDASTKSVNVRWRARLDQGERRFVADRVFNCSGPSSRIADDSSHLFSTLLTTGRLLPCPYGLGVQVDTDYKLLDAMGNAQGRLFYAGPLLKAQHWETTAVPELRVHAEAAARSCLLAA